jgi:glutathione S-transferase
MKLYACKDCPYSRRVRIVLAEQGVTPEYVELSPSEPHPPELEGKTPSSRGVPVLLVRDDLVIWHSSAIVFWLDAAYRVSLVPSARDIAAIAHSWFGWAARHLYEPLERLPARAAGSLRQAIDDLDKMAPPSGWMMGQEFTIADVALAAGLVALPPEVRASLPPKTASYLDRLEARPSVRGVAFAHPPSATSTVVARDHRARQRGAERR